MVWAVILGTMVRFPNRIRPSACRADGDRIRKTNADTTTLNRYFFTAHPLLFDDENGEKAAPKSGPVNPIELTR